MRKLSSAFWISAAVFGAGSFGGAESTIAPARFGWVEYTGRDGVFERSLSAGQYRNPIISGFYPDPSIVRVNDDYYMVNSTFGYFPGLPIWHSRDLVAWTQIGNAIDRPGMVDLTSMHIGKDGLYAPTIRFHAGRFVIANTCVRCGGNFVITATDPSGPWSDPIWVKGVGGIDPQIFFEGDRAWMVNHDDPAGPSRYDGHKAIWIREIDPRTFQPIAPAKMVVDGGVNLAEKPGYVEGPHVFKRGAYYYLSAAEGGTGADHRQAIWRSSDIMGPYEAGPANPILTQRTLPPGRPDPITSTGHADMVETQHGEWWAVFLGTRTYDRIQFNTGRETFLLPVTWQDGWPSILQPGLEVPYRTRRPALPVADAPHKPITGNFTMRENFDGVLPRDWMFVRVPGERWWTIIGGALALTPRRDRLGDVGQPSLIGQRLRNMHATITTQLRFAPSAAGDEAGLIVLQNDNYYYAFGLTRDAGGKKLLTVRKRDGGGAPAHGRVVARVPITLRTTQVLYLRILVDAAKIRFAYSFDGRRYLPAAHSDDATLLSSMRSDGFNGATVGPYAERGL